MAATSQLECKALLVDPDEEESLALTRYLAGRGWLVRRINDAREALRVLESFEPILLLVELEGAMDGFELLAWVRARRPALVVAALARQETAPLLDAKVVASLGVADVIVRPCAFPILASKLEALVDGGEMPCRV